MTLVVAVALLGALASAQERAVSFPSAAEAITVDVSVVDKEGRPVLGLGLGDFTVLEDGKPQALVGFESRVPPADRASGVMDATDVRMASNERQSGSPGRTLALLIDDLGIEPLRMTHVTKELGRWLDSGVDSRDEVTIVTSSGAAWWSDSAGEGRADLLAVLARIKGTRRLGNARDAMSDWEAYSIDALDSPGQQATESASGMPSGFAACSVAGPSNLTTNRLSNRWFTTGACLCDASNPGPSIAACRALVRQRAREISSAATERNVGLLAGVERLSLGLAGTRGRKAVIVFSEGLLRDTDRKAFERAVDASRRGNTVVSFVDVRGLIAMPSFGVEQVAPAMPGDLGGIMAALDAEVAGGEQLAETTGGSMVRNGTDIADNVARLADESSAYYLLGYQSDRPRDGKWHKLEVKVSRPGVQVRARRGYFATDRPSASVWPVRGKKNKKDKKSQEALPVRALDPALAVGGERAGIGLRAAPYVFEMDASGTARVLVAVEVDTATLAVAGASAQRTAHLDVTVVGVTRDQPSAVTLDSRVDLALDAKGTGGWWIFSRELRLPPGPAQIRVLIRDTSSGQSGLVAQRLEIPAKGTAYLSTPILTDRLSAPQSGRSARIVPIAHRRFPPRGNLFCAYEVFVSPGRDLQAIPRVTGSYTLQDGEGKTIATATPSLIAIGLDAQISRLFSVPLGGLEPGPYRLTIRATDPAARVDLAATEAFVVEPPTGGDASPGLIIPSGPRSPDP